jgi:hypothetical protein
MAGIKERIIIFLSEGKSSSGRVAQTRRHQLFIFRGLHPTLGHLSATLSTAAARLDTVVHRAHPFTTAGARFTNLGADATDTGVKRRPAQHKVGAGLADFSAVDHQAKVGRFGVPPAGFQTMVHRLAQTDAVAGQAIVDTLLHGRS